MTLRVCKTESKGKATNCLSSDLFASADKFRDAMAS